MKRFLPLLLIGLTGCWLTVNSPNPFYTEATRVSLPAANGEWDVLQTNRVNQRMEAESTWVLAGTTPVRLRLYTDAGSATGTMVFFQVTGKLYCDKLINGAAYHHLYRADLADKRLQLAELDGNWLTNAIAHGRVNLPTPGSNCVVNAAAPQWVTFLEHLSTNDDAFGNTICLTRCAASNFTPARRQP